MQNSLIDFHQREYDFCIIGDTISSDFLSHILSKKGFKVLRINTFGRHDTILGTYHHAWLWNVKKEAAKELQNYICFSEKSFEYAYFDAKNSKCFKSIFQIKNEIFGDHEKAYFNQFLEQDLVDISDSIEHLDISLCDAIDGVQVSQFLFEDKKILGLELARVEKSSTKKSQFKTLKATVYAKNWIVTNPYELYEYVTEENLKNDFQQEIKFKKYLSGFGVHFVHDETKLNHFIEQKICVPMTVNPQKLSLSSHLTGFFKKTDTHKIESVWVSFFTEEELQDNNEILKKVKNIKKALDRAVMNFSDSILKESVAVNLRFFTEKQNEARNNNYLNLYFISDDAGPEKVIKKILDFLKEFQFESNMELENICQEQTQQLQSL
jgi:hypothetical protein